MRNRVLGSSPSGGNIMENKGHCENEFSQIYMKKYFSQKFEIFSQNQINFLAHYTKIILTNTSFLFLFEFRNSI